MELGREEDEEEEEEERPLETVGNIFARSIRSVSATETIEDFLFFLLIWFLRFDVKMNCDLCLFLSPSPVPCFGLRSEMNKDWNVKNHYVNLGRL